jgi:CO/xanthine dehydrogenase FAD-binding subunit
LTDFKIVGPNNLQQVIDYTRDLPGDFYYINGGTDLIIQLREQKVFTDTLIDLSQVSDLRYIKKENGRIKIGAGTTFADISKNDLVQKNAQLLAMAAAQVGSVQIRNRATIGGNIANAGPAADSLPVLMALQASVTTVKENEIRTIPFSKFITDVGKTCLHKKELILEVDFPIGNHNRYSIFKKVGSRTAVTTAKLSMAAVAELDYSLKKINSIQLTLGALGRPIRLSKVENLLLGVPLTVELADEAGKLCGNAVEETIPHRKSLAYKRWVAQGLGKELVLDLIKKLEL